MPRRRRCPPKATATRRYRWQRLHRRWSLPLVDRQTRHRARSRRRGRGRLRLRRLRKKARRSRPSSRQTALLSGPRRASFLKEPRHPAIPRHLKAGRSAPGQGRGSESGQGRARDRGLAGRRAEPRTRRRSYRKATSSPKEGVHRQRARKIPAQSPSRSLRRRQHA